MNKLITIHLLLFIVGLYSCQNKSATQVLDQQVIQNKHKKDFNDLNKIYAQMVLGFENNNFKPYYSCLDEHAIVIDGNGKEVHGKDEIVKHFEHQLETTNFELLNLDISELLVTKELALGTSVYTARLYNDKIDSKVKANWHLVWKKNVDEEWKIYREVYNFIK